MKTTLVLITGLLFSLAVPAQPVSVRWENINKLEGYPGSPDTDFVRNGTLTSICLNKGERIWLPLPSEQLLRVSNSQAISLSMGDGRGLFVPVDFTYTETTDNQLGIYQHHDSFTWLRLQADSDTCTTLFYGIPVSYSYRPDRKIFISDRSGEDLDASRISKENLRIHEDFQVLSAEQKYSIQLTGPGMLHLRMQADFSPDAIQWSKSYSIRWSSRDGKHSGIHFFRSSTDTRNETYVNGQRHDIGTENVLRIPLHAGSQEINLELSADVFVSASLTKGVPGNPAVPALRQPPNYPSIPEISTLVDNIEALLNPDYSAPNPERGLQAIHLASNQSRTLKSGALVSYVDALAQEYTRFEDIFPEAMSGGALNLSYSLSRRSPVYEHRRFIPEAKLNTLAKWVSSGKFVSLDANSGLGYRLKPNDVAPRLRLTVFSPLIPDKAASVRLSVQFDDRPAAEVIIEPILLRSPQQLSTSETAWALRQRALGLSGKISPTGSVTLDIPPATNSMTIKTRSSERIYLLASQQVVKTQSSAEDSYQDYLAEHPLSNVAELLCTSCPNNPIYDYWHPRMTALKTLGDFLSQHYQSESVQGDRSDRFILENLDSWKNQGRLAFANKRAMAIALASQLPQARQKASGWLFNEYAMNNDWFKEYKLLGALLLQDAYNEKLWLMLAQNYLHRGHPREAWRLARLLPVSEPRFELEAAASVLLFRKDYLDLALDNLESSRQSYWLGYWYAYQGKINKARHSWRQAGSAANLLLSLMDQAESLPDGSDLYQADVLSQWSQITRSLPFGQQWTGMEEDLLAFDQQLLMTDRLTGKASYRELASPDSPVSYRVMGPDRIRIAVRNVGESFSDNTTARFKISIGEDAFYLRSDTAPQSRFVNDVSPVSQPESYELDIPAGVHLLTVTPQSAQLIVSAQRQKPVMPLPFVPEFHWHSVAEVMEKNDRKLKGVKTEMHPYEVTVWRRDDLAEHQLAVPDVYDLLPFHAPDVSPLGSSDHSMELEHCLSAQNTAEHCGWHWFNQVEDGDITPANWLQLAMSQYPSSAILRKQSLLMEPMVEWVKFQDFDLSYGLVFKPGSASSISEYRSSQRTMLAVQPGETIIKGDHKKSLKISSIYPRKLRLKVRQLRLPYEITSPVTLVYKLSSGKTGTILLSDYRRYVQLPLPAGDVQLQMYIDSPNKGDSVGIALELSSGGRWKKIHDEGSLGWQVIRPGKPLVFQVEGPLWLRERRILDPDLENFTVLTDGRYFPAGIHDVTLETESEDAYVRLDSLYLSQEEKPGLTGSSYEPELPDNTGKSRGQGTVFSPSLLVEPDANQQPFTLTVDDRQRVIDQNAGSWGAYAQLSRSFLTEEDISDVETTTETGVLLRKRWQVHHAGVNLYNINGDHSSIQGIKGRWQWRPEATHWQFESVGEGMRQAVDGGTASAGYFHVSAMSNARWNYTWRVQSELQWFNRNPDGPARVAVSQLLASDYKSSHRHGLRFYQRFNVRLFPNRDLGARLGVVSNEAARSVDYFNFRMRLLQHYNSGMFGAGIQHTWYQQDTDRREKVDKSIFRLHAARAVRLFPSHLLLFQGKIEHEVDSHDTRGSLGLLWLNHNGRYLRDLFADDQLMRSDIDGYLQSRYQNRVDYEYH